MKKIYVFVAIAVLAGVIALFGGTDVAAKKNKPAEKAPLAWTKRCDKNDDGKITHCEIFQKLIVTETGQRMVEFAITKNADAEGARGVVVLPLGILLPAGVRMSVDGGQVFSFGVRYCTGQGCVAVLDLNKAVLKSFKKGEAANMVFKALNGQEIAVSLTLDGFAKVYKKL